MIKVISFVDRWLAGGIESYLVTHYEHMNLEDLEVTIVTTKKYTDLYDDRLNKINIEIIELMPNGKFNEINRTYKSLSAFESFLMEKEFDVIHLNIYNGVSLAFARLAKKHKLKRIIAHSHNSAIGMVRLKRLKTYAHQLGKIQYLKYVDDFWACSDLAADWLFTRKSTQQPVVLNNGIQTDKFIFDRQKASAFRKSYHIPADHLVIGSIGRLNNQKNQLFLIKIAKRLKEKGTSFTLIIAGTGELKEKLLDKVKEWSLQDDVLLIGSIQDTASFFSAIDLFLLPSLFEGNPIVAIEAQASGVPCMLSDKITRQAKMINQTVFLPLENVEGWVEQITQSQKVTDSEREQSVQEVKKAGFDILYTANTLNTYYRK